jgi:hypothetical protein
LNILSLHITTKKVIHKILTSNKNDWQHLIAITVVFIGGNQPITKTHMTQYS